jgi:hypothetical protein
MRGSCGRRMAGEMREWRCRWGGCYAEATAEGGGEGELGGLCGSGSTRTIGAGISAGRAASAARLVQVQGEERGVVAAQARGSAPPRPGMDSSMEAAPRLPRAASTPSQWTEGAKLKDGPIVDPPRPGLGRPGGGGGVTSKAAGRPPRRSKSGPESE